MDEIIQSHIKVDWHTNLDIQKRIEQDLDDLLYDFQKEFNFELDFDTNDKIIEEIKKIALKRY